MCWCECGVRCVLGMVQVCIRCECAGVCWCECAAVCVLGVSVIGVS